MNTASEQNSSNSKPGQLWVEPVGNIVVARVRGMPTADLIRECQSRVVALRIDTGCCRVMYDALELERPPIEIVLTQQALTDDFEGFGCENRYRRSKYSYRLPGTACIWRGESPSILQ